MRSVYVAMSHAWARRYLVVGLELGPLDLLQVFLAQLDIVRQLLLELHVVLHVISFNHVGKNLSLNVHNLTWIESHD